MSIATIKNLIEENLEPAIEDASPIVWLTTNFKVRVKEDVIGLVIYNPDTDSTEKLFIEDRDWLTSAPYTGLTEEMYNQFTVPETDFKNKVSDLLSVLPVSALYSCLSMRWAEPCFDLCFPEIKERTLSLLGLHNCTSQTVNWLEFVDLTANYQRIGWINKYEPRVSRQSLYQKYIEGDYTNKLCLVERNAIMDFYLWKALLSTKVFLLEA